MFIIKNYFQVITRNYLALGFLGLVSFWPGFLPLFVGITFVEMELCSVSCDIFSRIA